VNAADDETLTIVPEPRASIEGSSALLMRTADIVLDRSV
jgi:hypothetical protein